MNRTSVGASSLTHSSLSAAAGGGEAWQGHEGPSRARCGIASTSSRREGTKREGNFSRRPESL